MKKNSAQFVRGSVVQGPRMALAKSGGQRQWGRAAWCRSFFLWCRVLILLLGVLLLLSGCRLAGGTNGITIMADEEPSSQGGQSAAERGGFTGAVSPGTAAAVPGTVPDLSRAQYIICEVKGHVASPGVYDMAAGSRVSDLILRAGGVLKTGSLDLVNQARMLSDGEAVIVPAKGITRKEYEAMAVPGSLETLPKAAPSGGQHSAQTALININTASEGELDTIPGVGPVTAQNIINYRNENGPFLVIEDLKKVNRIGDKTFEKLKAFITVNP